ncbi:ParB/RepB/Spo0J family partition protein [Singulisphaera sp. PoT]|uniref:ParB/RepB/Spo0J family partition protein n=1 Tax=Singulisphaera sp. PoT TaxID=3411797 RepID=UPI003BF50A1C
MTLPLKIPSFTREQIAPDEIEAESQVRTYFDPEALQRLADSLRERQLQPILVWWHTERGKFYICAGERRWRAARMAGLPFLDCLIFAERPTAAEIAQVQLTENCLRENLNPIEQAQGFRLVMEQQGLNASQLAELLHLAVSTVTRALGLLELPDDLIHRVGTGTLPPAIAREVLRVNDPSRQREIVARADAEQMTAAQVAIAVARLDAKPKRGSKKPRPQLRTYKLPGFEAVITRQKLSLAPLGGKKAQSTEESLIAALEQLLDKLRAERSPVLT